MLTPLALNFSMALISGYSLVAMINLIFAGEANTIFKYVVTVIVSLATTIWFGTVMAEIVHLIKAL